MCVLAGDNSLADIRLVYYVNLCVVLAGNNSLEDIGLVYYVNMCVF